MLDTIPAYQGDPQALFIELLMIGAPWRSRGLGQAVVEQLAGDGTSTKLLAAVQVTNPRAVRFWQRLGFQITGPAELQLDGTVTVPLLRS